MKYAFAALFCLSLLACRTKKVFTYEEGLANCNKIKEEKKKENPNQLFYVGPDCMMGAQMPEFEATSMEGVAINKESLKGKVSIINFWFISCPPCVAEIPGFNVIVEKYGKDQINYIAIGRDRKKDIQEFLLEHPKRF
jgi:thiol-disulfide isomerase/thioredoxin